MFSWTSVDHYTMVTPLSKFVTAYVCSAQFVFNWLEAKLMIWDIRSISTLQKNLFTGQNKETMCDFPVQGFILDFLMETCVF